MRTWTDIDALHKAVNQIRETRARLETVKKWSKDNAAAKPVIDAADALSSENGADRGAAAAGQDGCIRGQPSLSQHVERTVRHILRARSTREDFGPTESQRQVFAYLHGQLAEELAKWQAVSASRSAGCCNR